MRLMLEGLPPPTRGRGSQATPFQPEQAASSVERNPRGQDASAASGGLDAAALAAAAPARQKQMIGDAFFPAIAKLQPELASKITGMMLEMDNSELLGLLQGTGGLQHCGPMTTLWC